MSDEAREIIPVGSHLPAKPVLNDQGRQSGGDSSDQAYNHSAETRSEEAVELVAYWRLLRRKRGTLILATGLGLLLGILVTLPQTTIYQAKTSLELLNLNGNFMNMKDVQQVEEESGFNLLTDIQTQIKILQSDTLLDRVFREMGGVDDDEPPGAVATGWRGLLNLPAGRDDARQKALRKARKDVKVKASGQTRIIEVTVNSTDRKIAAEFANRLTRDFIEDNIESRWEMTQQTGNFLSKQLDDMRAKLERSEDELQNYARQNGLLFTDDKTNVSQDRLKEVQAALTQAQADRAQKQSRWEMILKTSPDSLTDVLNDQTLRQYQERLADLKQQKADLAEAYTEKYPKVKKINAQIASVQKSLEAQRANILDQIRNEYNEAVRREDLLTKDYQEQAGVVTDQEAKAVQYNIVQREVDTNRQLYESMMQKVKEASIAGALRASNVRVVDVAKTPRHPDSPKLWLNALLGLLAGGFFGVAFVVTTEKADRMLQEPADLSFYLNLPELGVIPSEDSLTGARSRLLPYLRARVGINSEASGDVAISAGLPERLELVTWQKKLSLMAESFRAALTSILFVGQNGHRPKLLVITSPNPGEGKTTVATNLAIALAETGQRVLLMDGDTRKPRLHNLFDLENKQGLTSMLQNGFRGSEAMSADAVNQIVQETVIPGLFVMPSGPGVAGPTNLLYSTHFPSYLKGLQEAFDMIIVDTPPMLAIPDARVLGKMASGVVLVVRAKKTTRDAAVAARMRLKDDGIHVLGIIMNDWNPKHSPGGYYGYYDGYSRYYQKNSAYGPS
jgi:polysaccharide biosynthesis transport protein